MAQLSAEQVIELARIAGFQLDVSRAVAVAVRLSSVLADLDAIDDEVLAGAEPSSVFVPVGGEQDRDG